MRNQVGRLTTMQSLDDRGTCPSCLKFNCYGHQHDYQDKGGRVRICRCPDVNKQHGKLRSSQLKG